MSFLNPIMLFGLAAVSVPIIIHLLNRRKFQKVVWAAMRFLKISVEQNQRRMLLEDMILLALRCLLLALLAIALSRPAFLSKADVLGASKVTSVIVLDNSASMGKSDGTETRFEKARRAAEEVLDAMPPGSATAIFLASDIVHEAIPEPTYDLNLARRTIREAQLTDRPTDLLPAIQRAMDTLKERLVIRREVYLISDGQSAGWQQYGDIQNLLERNRADIKAHLLFVSEHDDRNLAITDFRLASGLSPARQALRFEVKVANFGKEEVRSIPVRLNINSEEPSDEFTIPAIPPGSSQSVSLFSKLPAEGFHSVTARIAQDYLPADDQRTLVLRALKELRVLLVDGQTGNEPRESETFFLRHALVPVSPEAAENYFLKATSITAPELPQARFDDFDVIILANVSDFNEAVVKSLEQYLRRGGGLMVFPGDQINSTFYNQQLFERNRILPATLGATRGEADQDAKYAQWQDKDFQHPIVSIWNDPASGTLSSARFFKHYLLNVEAGGGTNSPVTAQAQVGEARVIARYADGGAALAERPWGLGRVILWSSSADTAWNDLPVRPSFVPLLHRALGSLIERQDENLNLRVGEKFVRRVGNEFLEKDVTIFNPRQGDAIRHFRRVESVNGWPSVQYEGTDLAGIYNLSIPDPAFAMKFAVQPEAAESNLEELAPAQTKGLGDVANVISWSPNMSLRNLVERDRRGLEFWLPVLIAVIVLACVETFLSQFFSRSK